MTILKTVIPTLYCPDPTMPHSNKPSYFCCTKHLSYMKLTLTLPHSLLPCPRLLSYMKLTLTLLNTYPTWNLLLPYPTLFCHALASRTQNPYSTLPEPTWPLSHPDFFCLLVSLCAFIISSRSLNLRGRRGTTDDIAMIPFHPSLSSAALRESPNPIPVHSLMLSSHLFFCLSLHLATHI